MSEHTPGPWAYQLSPIRRTPCVVSAEGWICGEILNDHDPFPIEEVTANGRLIAAAPDLMAVAVEIDRFSLVIDNAVREASPECHEAVLAALRANRTALARADGSEE